MRSADLEPKDLIAWGLLLVLAVPALIAKLPTMDSVGRWLVAHDVLAGPARSLIIVEALGAGLDARRLVILVSLVLVLTATLLHRRLVRRSTQAVPR